MRLKTNSWIWIKDLDWNEIKLLYTSSFLNYTNVFYKEILNQNESETQTWSLSNSWDVLTQTWIENIISSWSKNNSNSWSENLVGTWIDFNSNSWTQLIFSEIKSKFIFSKSNLFIR